MRIKLALFKLAVTFCTLSLLFRKTLTAPLNFTREKLVSKRRRKNVKRLAFKTWRVHRV